MDNFGTSGMVAGYIGLGTMGEPMARNVVASGIDTLVFDLNADAMDRLAVAGARRAGGITEIAQRCSVVLVNVVNDSQVNDVVLSSGGLIEGMAQGTVVVVHSTVDPATCRSLADRLGERGVGLVDAPFTGGAAAAVAGTLSLLVGGEDWCVDVARPALEAEGTVMHLGSVGLGELAKLGNNLVMGITMHAIAEALRLGRAGGLGESEMLKVLTSGAANSWLASNWDGVGRMAAHYPNRAEGIADLTRKDLSLALNVAASLSLDLPVTGLAVEGLDGPYGDALDLWSRSNPG